MTFNFDLQRFAPSPLPGNASQNGNPLYCAIYNPDLDWCDYGDIEIVKYPMMLYKHFLLVPTQNRWGGGYI